MASMAKVWDTVELVEAILLDLPSRVLVRARGIDRFIKNVIEKSPAIRYKLFLLDNGKTARPRTFLGHYSITGGSRPEHDIGPMIGFNELLMSHYVFCAVSVPNTDQAVKISSRIMLRPGLHRTLSLFKATHSSDRKSKPLVSYFADMFITRPPTIHLLLVSNWQSRVLINESGIKFSDLLETIRSVPDYLNSADFHLCTNDGEEPSHLFATWYSRNIKESSSGFLVTAEDNALIQRLKTPVVFKRLDDTSGI